MSASLAGHGQGVVAVIRTAEQQRAQRAWKALTDRFGAAPDRWNSNGGAKAYLTALRQTSTRVHVSGIGQALAFLRSRDNDGKMAATDLAGAVLADLGLPPGDDPALELINRIKDGDLILLMRATEEAMAYVSWLSRYLQGAGIEPDDVIEENNAGEGGN